MRRCVRGEPPAELAANADRWTTGYVARRDADPAAAFWWPDQVNQRLLPVLLEMTEEHCAYCDGAST